MEMNFLSGALELVYAFGAGLLSSLTPCVYPMIPITLSIFGATESMSRRQAFGLSLLYVLGIALTYTTLGVLSAQTGMLFGSLLGNPVVVVLLVLFLVVLGLHSLDVIQLPFHRLQAKSQNVGGKGAWGALLMGLVSGLVASPCVGPVLALILIKAASSSSPLWSGAMLFSYSIGLGMIFLVLGTFSGALKYLPRSGNWLLIVKNIIAILVFGTAVSLLYSANIGGMRAIGEALRYAVIPLAVLGLCGVWYAHVRSRGGIRLGACVALALVAFSLFVVKPEVQPQATGSAVAWRRGGNEILDIAAPAGKPFMVDLYAEWCAACHELDNATFADQRVARVLAGSFTAVKVDFTSENAETEKISEKYKVMGLPCVLFLDRNGNEIPGSRVSGFMKPEDFLSHIEKFKNI